MIAASIDMSMFLGQYGPPRSHQLRTRQGFDAFATCYMSDPMRSRAVVMMMEKGRLRRITKQLPTPSLCQPRLPTAEHHTNIRHFDRL